MTHSATLTLSVGTLSVTLLSAAVALVTAHSAATTPPAVGQPICIVGPPLTIATTASRIETAARTALLAVPGVDGAYLQESVDGDEIITINVLASEHGIVEREALFKIEDDLAEAFGTPFALVVRAHQGRDMRSMAGPNLLFARG